MEMNSIVSFFEDKAVLVTGGAGFLAKIFAEKVLRTQPNVKKVYLLLRAPDNHSASIRLQNEVIGKDLFKVLKQKMGANFKSFISEKVTVVLGDITCEDLAIKEVNLKEELLRDIDVIVNLAATTNFHERYDVSLNINTFGAKHILNFAKKCTKLKVLVHVSTAYVSGETVGLIKETFNKFGDALNERLILDIAMEKKLAEAKLEKLHGEGASEETIKMIMKDLGLERSKLWGWPNVYVSTKALGEMVLMKEKGDIPLVILRPSIVTSTFKEPFPGWVEGMRTVDSFVVAYGKGRLTCLLGDPETILDMIPADMVVNVILVAAMAHSNDSGAPTIYHVGSSLKNPMSIGTFHKVADQYFNQHPWINEDGKPVIVSHIKVFDSMTSFDRHLTFRYLLPLKGLELLNMAFCGYFKRTYMDTSRRINSVKRLVGIYRPYLFFKGIYDDTNTEKLRLAARERGEDTDEFYFDPKAIDWEDYFINTHLPGVVKYVLK